jgi:hypothetical protein
LGEGAILWHVRVATPHTCHNGGPLTTQAYLRHQGLEECAAAREQFGHLVGELQSAPVLGMERGEVEGLVSREGTELPRLLLQGHLDLRSEREREAITGRDGVVRTRCREGGERDLMSVFGEV